MNKENGIIPQDDEQQLKSTIGYFPTEKQLQEMILELPQDEQEIFIPAYKSMQLMNNNHMANMEFLKAYCHEFARYWVLTREGQSETTTDINAGQTTIINPCLKLAHDHLTKAVVISKMLGLDVKSRGQIQQGPPPEKPETGGANEFKKKLHK